jgi:hypothetical protein
LSKYLLKEYKINIMSKGIAIDTVLMLLVGIVVVGILIFLVYRYVIGPLPPQEECRALAISWCTMCKNHDPTWSTGDGPTISPKWTDLKCENYFPNKPTDCKASTWCSGFIQVS